VAYISDIDDSGPVGSDDRRLGDNEIKQLKTDVYQSFPNVSGQVSKTHTQLNDTTEASATETISASWTFSADLSVENSITFDSGNNLGATSYIGASTGADREILEIRGKTDLTDGAWINLYGNGDSGTNRLLMGVENASSTLSLLDGQLTLAGRTTDCLAIDREGNNTGGVLVTNDTAGLSLQIAGTTGDALLRTTNAAGNSDTTFLQQDISANTTLLGVSGGIIRKADEGGILFHDNTANTGGKITVQSGGSVPGAGTGANGDIYLIY